MNLTKFKGDITSILAKLSLKENFSNLYVYPRIIPITKSEVDFTRKPQANFLMGTDRNVPNNLLASYTQQRVQNIRNYDPMNILQMVNTKKSVNITHHSYRLKRRNYIIIPRDGVRSSGKIQHPHMIKLLNRRGGEGNFLRLVKGISDGPTAKVHSVAKGCILNNFRNEARRSTFTFSI